MGKTTGKQRSKEWSAKCKDRDQENTSLPSGNPILDSFFELRKKEIKQETGQNFQGSS
jgi:hypothetical protein